MRLIVAIVIGTGACITTDTTPCGDGRCLAGTTCAIVEVGPTVDRPAEQLGFCVQSAQLTACSAIEDGMSCVVGMSRGTCHGGACFSDECGNRLVDAEESCDDGNAQSADGCASDCRSDERCPNGVVDSSIGEACDDGNVQGHDGCSTTCDVEQAHWEEQVDHRPRPRFDYGFAFDPVRHRGVMFGGALRSSTTLNPQGDTHEWDGQRWQSVAPGIAPLPRTQLGMAYDARRGVVVLHGGYNGAAFDETWEWDGTAWSQRTSTSVPPRRANHAMAYDPIRQRVVIFGGFAAPGTELAETWAWDGTTWESIGGVQPPKRAGAAMAFDPVRGVLVMYGGAQGSTVLGDLWELTATGWVDRTPTGTQPAPRVGHAMAFDPLSQRIVIAGGGSPGTPTQEVWSWDGAAWTNRTPMMRLPYPSTGFELASDPIRGRLLLWGPDAAGGPLVSLAGSFYEWEGTGWKLVDLQGLSMGTLSAFAAARHVAVADPERRRFVVFGGDVRPDPIGVSNDTWEWNGKWYGSLFPAPVPARYGAAMVAMDLGVVMYGGRNQSVGFDDTWQLTGSTWMPLGVGPPARSGHVMAYDPASQTTVMFGGETLNGIRLAETWIFDGSVWTQQTATGAVPEARTQATMAYHPERGRVVMFGGVNGLTGYRDTWEWDAQMRTWQKIEPATLAPPPRFGAALAWDAARHRLVLVGGRVGPQGQTQVANDVWEASWTGGVLTWQQIATTGEFIPRADHVLVPALDGAGVLAIGGSTFDPTAVAQLGDVWLLRWDGATSYETCTDRDTDGDELVGCVDPDCWSLCTPLCPPGSVSCGPTSTCGDQMRNDILENCYLCPEDFGPCVPRCGDFTCDSPTETADLCPGDCP